MLKETQLITYALIKLQGTGLYTKAIELWQRRGVKDRQSWADFRQFMIEQFERMLREGTGPSIVQEGYGTLFNAMEAEDTETDDGSLLMGAITKYAERASAAESKVTELESGLATLQHQFAAFMSQAAPMQMQQAIPMQQASFFGQQGPPAFVQVPSMPLNKKRKSPRDGASQGQPQQQQWGQSTTPMAWQPPTPQNFATQQLTAQWNAQARPQQGPGQQQQRGAYSNTKKLISQALTIVTRADTT